MEKGVLITFEGPEGSGKSTQVALLAQELEKRNFKVLCTREPGGTALGEEVRKILLNKVEKMEPLSELFLYAAARFQHTVERIKPALEKGQIIICDRYLDSSIAYQAYGRGLDLQTVEMVNNLATDLIKPDITILLDLDPEEGLGRFKGRELDRMEKENLLFHRRVRQGYLELGNREERFLVFEADLDERELHSLILSKVLYYLVERGG